MKLKEYNKIQIEVIIDNYRYSSKSFNIFIKEWIKENGESFKKAIELGATTKEEVETILNNNI